MLRRILITGALTLAACGPRPGTAPASEGLRAYLEALRSDDPRPLYDMLSEEQQAAIPYETWKVQWQTQSAERAQHADQVQERWQGPIQARAEVRYADGQLLNLRQTDTGWRLDDALVSTGSAPTPKQALGQFVTALENRDLSVLLSLLSKDRRESIEQRLASFLAGLSEQQASGSSELFATSDTRTELNWSHENVRYRLVFVLEGANWRLDELHMGPDPAAPPIAEEEPPPPEPAIRSW